MVSCSHWGMFACYPPRAIVSREMAEAFKSNSTEWLKPDGIIWLTWRK